MAYLFVNLDNIGNKVSEKLIEIKEKVRELEKLTDELNSITKEAEICDEIGDK